MTLVTIYDCFLVIFTYQTLRSHRWEFMGASEIRGHFEMTNSEGTNSRMTNSGGTNSRMTNKLRKLEGQILKGQTPEGQSS